MDEFYVCWPRMLRQVYLLAGIVVGCLGVVPTGAAAAPIILPSHHNSPRGGKSVVFVPPERARVCIAQFGDDGRTTRPYPVQLGGPSRRVSWNIGRRTRGRWAVYVSCGTSKSSPTSLGTVRRVFVTGRSRRPRIIVRPGSFRSTSGWIPAHPPKTKKHRNRGAHASDSNEIDTGYARSCSGLSRVYMSKAYAVGYGYGARIGFAPTWLAYDTENVEGVWSSLQDCVPYWPSRSWTELGLRGMEI